MTKGLHRYQQVGDSHFITFSCYHRLPFLGRVRTRVLFENALERIRKRYGLAVFGYVVMPEPVHLLVNEPRIGKLDRAIQALKLSVTVRQQQRPFWQTRYYDFNVFSASKHAEKLRYMHRNPVKRGLVANPEDWAWSSFRHWATGEIGTIEVESQWTASRREAATAEAHVPKTGRGAPGDFNESNLHEPRPFTGLPLRGAALRAAGFWTRVVEVSAAARRWRAAS
jgi:putative transposase